MPEAMLQTIDLQNRHCVLDRTLLVNQPVQLWINRAVDPSADEARELPLRIGADGERAVVPLEILDDDGAVVYGGSGVVTLGNNVQKT